LVPRLGVNGAASSSLISSIVFSALVYSVSRKFYKIRYGWDRISKAAVVFTLIYVIGDVLEKISQGGVYFGLRLILLLFVPILLFAWNFVRKDEIEAAKQQLTHLSNSLTRSL
jgi:Na+/citrate or Na+/malate symporter